MIRRNLGNQFALITQDDHARLAGELVSHLGTMKFRRPEIKWREFVTAVTLHDRGWAMQDAHPTRNRSGLPLDVFETPRDIAVTVWPGAPDAARTDPEGGPWAELLVSLHVLSLSAYAVSHEGLNRGERNSRPEDQMRERFLMNKFQHREIERQVRLRTELGLSTDIPLSQGLAQEGASQAEDELRRQVRWLQALDQISLGLCCTQPPMTLTVEVHPTPGHPGESLTLQRDGNDLLVRPWPFAVERIEAHIPARLVEARAYESDGQLHDAYHAAETTQIPCALRAW